MQALIFIPIEIEKALEDEVSMKLCVYNLPQLLAIGALPIMTIGLLLASISVFVYTRQSMRKATVGFLLACLSIFEFLFLLTSLITLSIAQIPMPYITCNVDQESTPYRAYIMVYIYPFVQVFKYMTVFISILISIQQWIAVFLPLKVRTWCDMKKTKRFLGVAMLASFFFASPRFLEQKIDDVWKRETKDEDWVENRFFQAIDNFDNNVFNAFLIFFVLFIINSSIICLLKWSEHERTKLTKQSVNDRKTSLMLFAVLLAYVVTHFPSMLIVYHDSHLQKHLPGEMYDVREELSNFFMCCHPLFSFADYLIFSHKYRNIVNTLIFRR